MEYKKENIEDAPRNPHVVGEARVGQTVKAQHKLNRWQTYQEYQSATERVLRTLNITEGLSLIFLFAFAPVARYGFIPMSGILWFVLLFGGTRFSKEVEERFPGDKLLREDVRIAAGQHASSRQDAFIKSANGRLFVIALLQAAGIILLLLLR